MTVDEALVRLETELRAGDVKVRRAGVELAARLLKERACGEECRARVVALLRERAANDYPSVQAAARTVLDNLDQGGDPTWGPDERRHMVRVPCKRCGHINFFDRRRICTDSRPFYRTRGETLDEIAETCGQCGGELNFGVDCEGY